MREFLSVVMLLLVLAAFCYAVSLFFTILAWPVGAYTCSEQAEDFEHRYLVISAKCQVRINGQWINFDNNFRAEDN